MMSGQLHAPANLPLDKTLGTHRAGGWVGPTPGLGVLQKK